MLARSHQTSKRYQPGHLKDSSIGSPGMFHVKRVASEEGTLAGNSDSPRKAIGTCIVQRDQREPGSGGDQLGRPETKLSEPCRGPAPHVLIRWLRHEQMSPNLKDSRRALRQHGWGPEGARHHEVGGSPHRWILRQVFSSAAPYRHMVSGIEFVDRHLEEFTTAGRSVEQDDRRFRPECRQHKARESPARPHVHHSLGWVGE